MRSCLCAALLVLVVTSPALARATGADQAGAQPTASAPGQPVSAAVAAVVSSARPDTPVTLKVFNRSVVVLRASVLGRSSADRVGAAELLLQEITRDVHSATAAVRPIENALIVSVDGRDVFMILPADVDTLAGETLESKGTETLARLQLALDEEVEARSPGLLARGTLFAVSATVLFALIVLLLRRLDRVVTAWVGRTAERRLKASDQTAAVIVRQARLVPLFQRLIDAAWILLALIVAYAWLGFVLRQFPYTRPWGDSLRGFLAQQVEWLALGVVHAIPGLVTVLLIAIVTKVLTRLSALLFDAVEQGRLTIRGLYPETAAPTRRIVTLLLWVFALIVAYPFLPGSGTEAFKGVSVFLGVVVSLGSTGIVNQMMSGLTATYSRAVRIGDFVRVGEVEGTVMHLGVLAMKVATPRHEDVTIPNSVLISREVTNYSRSGIGTNVLVTTSVTIGYDTPWRQVHAMLLNAAARTPGIRRDPAPIALQAALEDFYVKYVVAVTLEDPRSRLLTLAALHANIQDAFNEYGVQIMSPHYWSDPHAPKVVPKAQWSPPPAGKE